MHSFTEVDVFTDELLLGNPVAVVHDADDLTGEQMSALARWTNLSETTFLLRPTDPAADYRLRIFTTDRELPFAGHPTLGSARAFLAAGGVRSGPHLVQECGSGLVRIRDTHGRLAFAAPPLLRGGAVADDDLAVLTAALHVRPDQVLGAQWADNGPGWVALLLADAATVLALEPDAAALAGWNVGVLGAQPAGADTDFEVRTFFVSGTGPTEDPVTGSFNAGAAQWLIPAGLAAPSYTVSQGTRLQRRGRLFLEQLDGDLWVGGDTVVGVTGSIAI